MTKKVVSEIPKVVSSGELKIGNAIIRVHVLDNGKRVLEQEDFYKLFEIVLDQDTPKLSEEEVKSVAKFIKGIK